MLAAWMVVLSDASMVVVKVDWMVVAMAVEMVALLVLKKVEL